MPTTGNEVMLEDEPMAGVPAEPTALELVMTADAAVVAVPEYTTIEDAEETELAELAPDVEALELETAGLLLAPADPELDTKGELTDKA